MERDGRAPGRRMPRRPRARRWLLAAATAAATALAAAAGAQANEFEIRPGSFAMELSDSQAAGHPDITTTFEFTGTPNPFRSIDPFGLVKDIVVDAPPGVVANAIRMPQCKAREFRAMSCPVESQVGYVELKTALISTLRSPVYNMVPPGGAAAMFQFRAFVLDIQVIAEIRDDDYGVRMTIPDVPTQSPLWSSKLTFWGVPAARRYDNLRDLVCMGMYDSQTDTTTELCTRGDMSTPVIDPSTHAVPSQAPVVPFTSAPATCEPMTARMRANTWTKPNTYATAEATVPALSGCEKMAFNAGLKAEPTSTAAGAPTGLAIDIEIPDVNEVGVPGTPPLKKAVVTLPEGMVISPSAADGLAACAEAQIGFGRSGQPACPRASEIGSVEIVSPLQSKPLTGSIYLLPQTSSQLLRMALYARGAGVELKLPGTVDLDPVTGRVTTTFDDQPMLAASRISLRFNDGPRAVLANPTTCGVKTVSAELTAHGGAVARASSSFTISADGNGAPCPPIGFAPTFSAGTIVPVAGAPSTFTVTFGRSDRDAILRAIDLELPNGLTGRVADVELCPDAAAAAGTCDERSRIGSAQVAAGPGASPFWLPGRVYMTEGYKGAPFGLAIVVPAKAGPLDLGTVVVRAAVHVDKHTAALRIVSDPMPTILRGIPLQIRTVNITIDRDGFMLNPTSCEPTRINASVHAASGETAAVGSRFQVGDCGALRYQPRMALRVGARGKVTRGRPTPLKVVLTQPAGQANHDEVMVRLPKTLAARMNVVNRACSQEQYEAGDCERARVGTARVVTPILRDPLQGPAYLVRAPGRALPNLVVQLRGQVAVDLVGKVTIPRSLQLETRFQGLPDIAVSRFELNLTGGSKSPLAVARNLCTKASRRAAAQLEFAGQNGIVARRAQRLQIAGCAKR